MKHPLVRLMLVIPMCGALIATLVTAAWLVVGQPNLAQGATWFQVTKVGDSDYSGAPDKPFFFLALGNDGRADSDKGLGDAIHVIGVNPVTHQATMLDVPRDTQAPSGDKINAYHALQGLPGIVDQLNKMMGIQIEYAITTNFPGIAAMVDEIGGIWINVPDVQFDTDSGANIPVAGPQFMNGDQVLRFSRNRKDYPIEGDLARTRNQGLVILSALATMRGLNLGDAGIMKMTAILARHVRLHNLDLAQLFRLGKLALTIDPNTTRNCVIPIGGNAGGSNLALAPAAQAMFQDFADDGVVANC